MQRTDLVPSLVGSRSDPVVTEVAESGEITVRSHWTKAGPDRADVPITGPKAAV